MRRVRKVSITYELLNVNVSSCCCRCRCHWPCCRSVNGKHRAATETTNTTARTVTMTTTMGTITSVRHWLHIYFFPMRSDKASVCEMFIWNEKLGEELTALQRIPKRKAVDIHTYIHTYMLLLQMLSLSLLLSYMHRQADSKTVKINTSESMETLFLKVGIHIQTDRLRDKHTHNRRTLRRTIKRLRRIVSNKPCEEKRAQRAPTSQRE